MDVNELVQGKWLSAQDVKTSPTKTVVILSAGELVDKTSLKGEKYKALVVSAQIDGKTKDWRINYTTIRKLVEKYGTETNAWIGKPILLTTMYLQGGKEGIVPQ